MGANAKPTPYPLGRSGLSIAGPVASVSGSTKVDAGRRLQTGDTEIFTITVVALGPLLQPISKVVRNLDFINAVREALADAGRTSIYQKENAAIFAATLAAEKMGSPYTAADFTVTAVQNVDGTWSVSVEVDVKGNAANAQSAAVTLSATTNTELETALRSGSGSVKAVAPARPPAQSRRGYRLGHLRKGCRKPGRWDHLCHHPLPPLLPASAPLLLLRAGPVRRRQGAALLQVQALALQPDFPGPLHPVRGSREDARGALHQEVRHGEAGHLRA